MRNSLFYFLIVLALVGMVGSIFASVGKLRVYNRSDDVTSSSAYIKYLEGATDDFDTCCDSTYNSGNPNILHTYFNIPGHQLMVDARDPDSTTDFNLDLYKNGTSADADNYLRFRMYDDTNFEWKNLFLGDVSDSNDIVADIKYVIVSDGRTYGDGTPYGDFYIDDVAGTTTGVYDTQNIFVFNYSDLNRDRKVNLKDFSILSTNFGETGINVGSNPTDPNDYSDINRSGTVDLADVFTFIKEYLWDADDPTTW